MKIMHYVRMLALPFACLAMFATLTFYSPLPASFDDPAMTAGARFTMPDFALIPADQGEAIVQAAATTDVPLDAHGPGYTVANQPLSPWRLALDVHRHIDPHIRVG